MPVVLIWRNRTSETSPEHPSSRAPLQPSQMHCLHSSLQFVRGSKGGFSQKTLSLLLVMFLLLNHARATLDGTLLSTSSAQSCANIYDTEGTAKMQCNEATVLQLELTPDQDGGGIKFLFQNTEQSGAGGGPGQPMCDDQNPGTCVGGEPFFVEISVSPMLISYPLDLVGLEVPFGYAYSSCLTRAAGHGASDEKSGPYPDVVLDSCGPTMSYNLEDYTKCNQEVDFSLNKDYSKYSECVMMCGVDKNQAWKDDLGFCTNPDNYNDLKEDFRRPNGKVPDREHLTCRELDDGAGFSNEFINCMPNFPNPYGMCPCAGGYTSVSERQNPSNIENYVPITVCKSGTCAGTCGSAIAVQAGDWCGNTDFGSDNPEACCNVDDPNSLCVNTNQRHRCLKCQPAGHEKDKKHYCYYLDLHIEFRCHWYGHYSNPTGLDLSAWCGSGDFVSGGWFDPSYNDADSLRYRDPRSCNCDANFVEKIYPVSPLCSPYIIRNPPRFEYTVNVVFTDLAGEVIDGSLMTVGSGWSQNNTFPPNKGLPLSQYTPDGFALSRVLSIDSSTGKKSSELHGFIVMCNNGDNPACSIEIKNITKAHLPDTNIETSSPDGRTNPWGGGYFGEDEAKVPLADMIFRYANHQAGGGDTRVTDKHNAAWWYYVTERYTRDYGRGCEQNGYFPGGDSDAGTANAMCNGPIGTCVPGIGTLHRGEVTDPPCNIAADWYKYIKNNGGTFSTFESFEAGSGCPRAQQGNGRAVPPHVPLDWDTAEPQYWVHAGRLFKERDPSLASVNIRLALSIAADFKGEVITQAPAQINNASQQCVLYMDQGTGRLTVSIDNKGAQTAQYVLQAKCTQGVVMSDPNGITFSQGPGVGGSDNTRTLGLTMLSDVQLTQSEEDKSVGKLVPSCQALLYPSGLVIQGHPMSETQDIQCIIDFAYPIIYPESGPDFHSENIGEYIPLRNGSTCKFYDPLCYVIMPHQDGFFTATQQAIIDLFLLIFIFALMTWFITKLMNLAYGEGVQAEGIQLGIEKKKRSGAATIQTAQERLAKEKSAAAAARGGGGGGVSASAPLLSEGKMREIQETDPTSVVEDTGEQGTTSNLRRRNVSRLTDDADESMGE